MPLDCGKHVLDFCINMTYILPTRHEVQGKVKSALVGKSERCFILLAYMNCHGTVCQRSAVTVIYIQRYQICPHNGVAPVSEEPNPWSNMASEEENREGRVALAVAFRTLEKLGLHEGVDNHLSLMVPAARGQGQVMLTNPYGLHWSEV